MKNLVFVFRAAPCAALLLAVLSGSPCRADDASCRGCHRAIEQGENVHAPVAGGECSSCHRESGGKVHPREKGAVTLVAEGAQLCYQCHDSKAAKKYIHSPVASGDCTACHDPHHAYSTAAATSSGDPARCNGVRAISSFWSA